MNPPSKLTLPNKVPRQRLRPVQSNIPAERAARGALRKAVEEYVARVGAVPPLPLDELREHAQVILREQKLEPIFENYTAILVNNAAWRDGLARIPYHRRLLLIPKCLRVAKGCPAPFDDFGLLCKECGLCSIHDLTVEAERLGYAVLIAEGSALVRAMIETGKIDAIVGVSCIHVLEKCFPHMEAAAVPGAAIPLLQDDCLETTVDLDQVWDLIHLSSDDRTYRLDIDELKKRVRSWFQPEALAGLLGPQEDETARTAYDFLARDGKRWRPLLAVAAYMALASEETGEEPPLGEDVQRAALAIECFHKASLIHDDIEDGDALRNGLPTVHVSHGLPVALNAGDFLLGEGYRLLAELGRADLVRIAAAGHVTLSRGQGRELVWTRDPRPIASMEVLEIFRQKTAAAFETALRIGACLGGADEAVHEVLVRYSESLGLAYQIRDDLDDAGESRLSLLLAIAHRRAGSDEERALIEAALPERGKKSPELIDIFVKRGVISKAEDLLAAYKEDAIRSLRPLVSPSLKGLLRRVVGKIFGEQLIEGYCGEFEARNAAGRAAGADAAGGSGG